MSILVVAPQTDNHALPVAEELRRRGHDVRIVDLGDFPAAPFTIEGSRVWVGDVLVSDVETVWLRRISAQKLEQVRDAGFAAAEWRHALMCAAQVMAATRWVNPLEAYFTLDGGWGKLRQLEAAKAVGLATPETLVTTDPDRARAFVERCHGDAIYKPFQSTAATVSGRQRALWTTRVEEGLRHAGWDAFRLAPGILQRRVDKALEVRATVLGDRVFACELESGHLVDYRTNYLSVPRRRHALPSEVEARLLVLHRKLGLEMGTADLIVDKEGQHVFLETNIQGQFLWTADVFEPGELLQATCDLLVEARCGTLRQTLAS